MRRLFLAILFGGVSATAMAAPAPVHDPGCGELQVVMQRDVSVYVLPRRFLRAGSDSIWSRGTGWRRGQDYVLNRLRGELRLLRQPLPGDTLRITACWLVSTLPLELQLMQYRPGPGVEAAAAESALAGAPAPVVARRPVVERDPNTAPAGASLSLSGNKTIAVDFGSNQDAFLRQSLDLTVSGTLAPGVELTGVLSDRNTPLAASGSTQSLESLDKVLIELKAPQGSASLGDLTLDLNRGEFGRLERRLQGVRGEWGGGGARGFVAAASAPGEYYRLQFFGTEGLQGPYPLTDRNGGTGITVVAGSEVVTVDGVRLIRGESADYAMDYERARITFSNRRPITAASRITVEYQYSVNRYRRNLLAAGGGIERGPYHFFVQGIAEGDDRGRPLDTGMTLADRLRLELAGDSASLAVEGGVASGVGDYDRVALDSASVAYVFAGVDSGEFAVQFVRVGEGNGDYADSSVVAGRTVYRYVGPGRGAHQVGRALPLPESHQLWVAGGGGRLGALSFDLEGAVSRLDRNVFSPLDDADNGGAAARATLGLTGDLPASLGTAGLSLRARGTDARFAPFERIEVPYAEEDWGLVPGTSLEHQRRGDVAGFWKPRFGGQLAGALGWLALPGGFAGRKSELEWAREGRFVTRARWDRAAGDDPRRRFSAGGRDRVRLGLGVRFPWLEPMLRLETDEQLFASDTGRAGAKFREARVELQSGRVLPWRVRTGVAWRQDERATPTSFIGVANSRTLEVGLESPAQHRTGAAIAFQHRELQSLTGGGLTRTELGSVRLRSEVPRTGVRGRFDVEVTSEAENVRARRLTFVGGGRGAYDALGNYVGSGDYDLVVTVSPELARIGRAATSAMVAWQFGRSPSWRGSRVEFDFESDVRRRGELSPSDALVSPGVLLGDPTVAGGSVLQRLETELMPGSRAMALRMRVERRVSSDRSYGNFSQQIDDRTASARWRARPAAAVSSEVEGRLRRQTAAQSIAGAAAYGRVLLESGGVAQLVYTPDARLRAAAVMDATWSRPELEPEATRTIRIGPDLGVGVGARGRAELGLRRAFVSGPPVLGLLPSADPFGPPRWEGSARFDYRVRESATLGFSMNGRERLHRTALFTGRAELKAYF